MSDYARDEIKDKIIMEREERRFARLDYCEKCDMHNECCPYYDKEEDSWDSEQCFKDGDFNGTY